MTALLVKPMHAFVPMLAPRTPGLPSTVIGSEKQRRFSTSVQLPALSAEQSASLRQEM
jgi:hypothetical protein